MRQYHSSLTHQSGVALIAVLLFLILIMVVGAIAVRQSGVDLNVAASDQAGTLLLNSSDSVLAHIEVTASGVGTSTAEKRASAQIMSQNNGPLGYFAVPNANERVGHQVSLCYRPKGNIFDLQRAYIRPLGNGFIKDSIGCDASKSEDYNSDRATSMTQIIVRGLEDQLSDNFDGATRGTSEAGKTDKTSPKVQVNSLSVLPSMSNKSSDEIKNCLARPVGRSSEYGNAQTANDCLKQRSIPSTFVVEEGILQDKESGGFSDKSTKIDSPCNNDDKCKGSLANPGQSD